MYSRDCNGYYLQPTKTFYFQPGAAKRIAIAENSYGGVVSFNLTSD